MDLKYSEMALPLNAKYLSIVNDLVNLLDEEHLCISKMKIQYSHEYVVYFLICKIMQS